jgi:hypothetical protein
VRTFFRSALLFSLSLSLRKIYGVRGMSQSARTCSMYAAQLLCAVITPHTHIISVLKRAHIYKRGSSQRANSCMRQRSGKSCRRRHAGIYINACLCFFHHPPALFCCDQYIRHGKMCVHYVCANIRANARPVLLCVRHVPPAVVAEFSLIGTVTI